MVKGFIFPDAVNPSQISQHFQRRTQPMVRSDRQIRKWQEMGASRTAISPAISALYFFPISIQIPILPRRHILRTLKPPCKVGQIGISSLLGNLGYLLICVNQTILGVIQTFFGYQFGETGIQVLGYEFTHIAG